MGEWAEPVTTRGLVGVAITVWAGRVPELMGGEKFSWMGGARQDQKLWGL